MVIWCCVPEFDSGVVAVARLVDGAWCSVATLSMARLYYGARDRVYGLLVGGL
ncbi:hypothetical protein Victoria_0081 [Pseudomonas phage Victoria]|nr:hypothetical protein Victoria_0081 [Pseudomonas phage Victoria]